MITITNIAVFFILIFSFVVFHLAKNYLKKHRISEDDEETEEGISHLADTDIVVYPFRGEWITLTKIEYLNIWKDMNRDQRSNIFNEQQKKLKQGLLKKVFFENGKKYYLAATERGKIFTSIHQKKDKIYREGN